MATDRAKRPVALGEEVVRELVARFGAAPEVKRIAEQAGRLLELAEQARVQVEADGLVVVTAKGTFAHPMVDTERRMRTGFLVAIRLLETPRRAREGRPTNSERLVAASRTMRYLRHGKPA